MKSFRILRGNKNNPNIPMQPTLVVELSVRDLSRILMGKEIVLPNKSTEIVVLRNATAYEAFNLAAPRAEE
jgi:hypothetical protein